MGQGKARSVSLRAQPRGCPSTHIPLAPPRCKGGWDIYLQLLLCKNEKTYTGDNKRMLLQLGIKQG